MKIHIINVIRPISLAVGALVLAFPAWSQSAKIMSVGSTVEVRKLAGPQTRVIDLQGRTVIPGLIDSHMHAIRAGQAFGSEVNWVGAATLTEALGRIHEASLKKKPGAWLIVAGGWNAAQFKEKRRPTQADLVAAATNNPVYIQLGYDWIVMTPAGFKALNISSDADLPRPGKLERDASGAPTGAIDGGGSNDVAVALFDRLPHPAFDEQVAGTKSFFRELNRLGLTAVGDPGGNNVNPEDYQPIFKVWREGKLTLRVAYTLCGPTAGHELEELKSLTQMLTLGCGDGMLKFNGLGERITWGMNNNDTPTADDKGKLYQIVKWAALRGLPVTIHWPKNETVDTLLSTYERVNQEIPIANLRWSVAHLNNASPQSLQRMKAMGMGWTIQRPNAASVENAKELGVMMGAGTDAHRVASYNPFTALEWSLVDSKNAGGVQRGPAQTPTRADALRAYTISTAWFSFDENKRGSLEPGKVADLAVLTKDYMTVPADQIGSIESLLTMVGGRIVYAAGPYASLEGAH